MPFDLIIWDCDGCLADSEILACGVAAEIWTRLGYPITAQQVVERFAEKSLTVNLRQIEKETGRSFPDFPYDEERRRREKVFEERLQTPPHLVETLDAIKIPMCVASGSLPERLEHCLKVVRLFERFEGHIFSAAQVANGKPAPDLFLFAAKQMKTAPERCLVIEDSVTGVQAGKAAGMTVFGFMGGCHVTDAWRARVKNAGADLLFDDMRELPKLVEENGSAGLHPRAHDRAANPASGIAEQGAGV